MVKPCVVALQKLHEPRLIRGFFYERVKMINKLNPEQVDRYSRHIIMPQVGSEGQRKLLNSK